MRRRETVPPLDFITALPVDECVRALRRGARRTHDQRLNVVTDGLHIVIESAGQAGGPRRVAPVWLFRLEADLTPTMAGTHVNGAVIHNGFLEGWLLVAGLVIAGFNVLGAILTLIEPQGGIFVLGLALILQALFAVYYAYYRRMIRTQARELVGWVYDWLTRPHGRYSKLL